MWFKFTQTPPPVSTMPKRLNNKYLYRPFDIIPGDGIYAATSHPRKKKLFIIRRSHEFFAHIFPTAHYPPRKLRSKYSTGKYFRNLPIRKRNQARFLYLFSAKSEKKPFGYKQHTPHLLYTVAPLLLYEPSCKAEGKV